MRLCSLKHEEICYESWDCPVCELKEQVDNLNDQITKLEEEIANYES